VGAELEGLIRNAASFSLYRQVDINKLEETTSKNMTVTMSDFMHALEGAKPAFGVSDDDFKNCIRNGIVEFGPSFDTLVNDAKLLIAQVESSDTSPLGTMLIEGKMGSGKTAFAAQMALNSGYPYVKLITPETMIGYGESGKCSQIFKIFNDAYKSAFSVIVVDDVERLLDFAPIGPKYSNAVLQTLLVLLRKQPPTGRKLVVFCTTTSVDFLRELGLAECFDIISTMPCLSTPDEYKKVLNYIHVFEDQDLDAAAFLFNGVQIPIKKFLNLMESVRKAGNDKDEKVRRLTYMVQKFKQYK